MISINGRKLSPLSVVVVVLVVLTANDFVIITINLLDLTQRLTLLVPDAGDFFLVDLLLLRNIVTMRALG
jgi:hypothetical protein